METLEEVIMSDHLGGHLNRTNIDEGAMQWLIDTFNPKTFLDIGCGPGGMVDYAAECGLEAMGIDGDPEVTKDCIYKHDFVKGPVDIDTIYDIGWSVEFVEHVYEDYMNNYMSAFKLCKVIVVTYAPPGTPGHHHVNLQEQPYWLDKFKTYGFTYSSSMTEQLREVSTMNLKKKSHEKRFVQKRGMVFVNDLI
jgi:hypothetical protein